MEPMLFLVVWQPASRLGVVNWCSVAGEVTSCRGSAWTPVDEHNKNIRLTFRLTALVTKGDQ
jgi:hypothetical protein